jgi:acyl-CoA thioester hydrolase
VSPPNVQHMRVRSHQTDLNGVVWHGAYFGIFDDARIESFRHFDYTYARLLEEGWMLVIRRVECDYVAPAYMDDELTIVVTVAGMTRATLRLHYDCRREDTLLAKAVITYAFLDSSGRPIRLPASLRDVIDQHAAVWGLSVAPGGP